jgi:hypothetical protein
MLLCFVSLAIHSAAVAKTPINLALPRIIPSESHPYDPSTHNSCRFTSLRKKQGGHPHFGSKLGIGRSTDSGFFLLLLFFLRILDRFPEFRHRAYLRRFQRVFLVDSPGHGLGVQVLAGSGTERRRP